MHPALSFQFERTAQEYMRWSRIPEDERSAAPAWWWGPALALRDAAEPLPDAWCELLTLPPGASSQAAAALLLNALHDQTSPTWPDEFPHRYRPPSHPS